MEHASFSLRTNSVLFLLSGHPARHPPRSKSRVALLEKAPDVRGPLVVVNVRLFSQFSLSFGVPLRAAIFHQ